MNNTTEFLDGLTTPLGYGYIEPDEVAEICVDNNIGFKELHNLGWVADSYLDEIAEAYVYMETEDIEAEEWLKEGKL